MKPYQKCIQERWCNYYQVLLILTDGIIDDLNSIYINNLSAAKDYFVELSKEPCSIIIVGVGDADFSNMRELDGDDVTL